MTNGESNLPSETDHWQAARDLGARLLDERNYSQAIQTLQNAVAGDTSGESHALLGLAHYQSQQYEQAAANYDAALERQQDNEDWREMCRFARANAAAEMNVAVPEHYLFDRG